MLTLKGFSLECTSMCLLNLAFSAKLRPQCEHFKFFSACTRACFRRAVRLINTAEQLWKQRYHPLVERLHNSFEHGNHNNEKLAKMHLLTCSISLFSSCPLSLCRFPSSQASHWNEHYLNCLTNADNLCLKQLFLKKKILGKLE